MRSGSKSEKHNEHSVQGGSVKMLISKDDKYPKNIFLHTLSGT